MKRRKSRDGLVSKVLKISPMLILEDDQGKYIPYCNYQWHKGIVRDINVCETRKCRHYQKYRLELKSGDRFKDSIVKCAKEYYDKFF